VIPAQVVDAGQPGAANKDVNPRAKSCPGDPRPAPIMIPDWTDATDWACGVASYRGIW